MEDRLDPAFQALTSWERRDVLMQLLDEDEVRVSMEQDHALSLVHVHLPKLSDDGYVEYREAGDAVVVSRGPEYGDVEPLIRTALTEFTERCVPCP